MSTRLLSVAPITLALTWSIFSAPLTHGQTVSGLPGAPVGGGEQPATGAGIPPAQPARPANELSYGSSLFSILERQPRNGFEVYVHSQESLWNQAQQSNGTSGRIHGYSANPYAGKSASQALSVMRAEYTRLHPGIGGAGPLLGGPLTAGGLSTGSPGSAGLPPRRPPSAAAPIAAAPAPPKAPVTDESSQQAAMKKYPALAEAGSPLNREFITRAELYRASTPQLFNDPNWPMKLAEECVTALATGNTVAK